MKSPSNLGFKANPFPLHGVPVDEDVPFITYPDSDLDESSIEILLKALYNEQRPACYIIVGDYGSGKTHLSKIIKKIAIRIGYKVKEETFGTSTSLYEAFNDLDYKTKKVLVLFDEVQGLYEKIRENPLVLSEFKRQLRNFLEGKREAETEEGLTNVKLFLFCTPQVKDALLHEEDLAQRFMLAVKHLPALEPFIGLNVAKAFIKTYAEKWLAETKLRVNPYYPFDRYTVLSLINLCPLIVEKKGGQYRPTTRFLVELLRHCFDYILEADLDKLTFKELPSALKKTNVLDMIIDLSPKTYKLEEIVKTSNGKVVAQFLGACLGWWTIPEIASACKIAISEVEKVLREEFSSVVNVERCWIINYEFSKEIKEKIEGLGERYRGKVEELFSIPWVTINDEPCYLVIPSIHLIDDKIENIFQRLNVKQQEVCWLKNSMEVFGVSLEGKFRKFTEEQIKILREFLKCDSIRREQKIYGQLRTIVTNASLKEQSILEPKNSYGEDQLKIVGVKVTPHVAAESIYYRVGLKFLSTSQEKVIEREFREIIEWLKTSDCDFVLVFAYPEILGSSILRPYMKEEVKWAPAFKRIFIRNLTEVDLVNILTNPEGFISTLEEIILSTIRNFNEGMLKEYLLMPFYGLKWAKNRLNPEHQACIFPKLENKWFKQVCEQIGDRIVREFIYENFKHPDSVTFSDEELIGELFDENERLKISEYERKIYSLLESQYEFEESQLNRELNKRFVSGALYKLAQANLTPYEFIVKRLLITKNLVKISQDYGPNGIPRVKVTLKRIPDEKYSLLTLIEDVKNNLKKDYCITFDDEKYFFSNQKYISEQLDKFQLIEEYVNEQIRDTKDLYLKAIFLSQLHYLSEALKKLRSQSRDDLSDIIQRVQKSISTIEDCTQQIINELSFSLNITPKSCQTVKEDVKRYLEEIQEYVEDGRHLAIVEKSASKIDDLAEKFREESEKILGILRNVKEKISENNRIAENIINKKHEAEDLLRKISRGKLREYFESTPILLERNLLENLSGFLERINNLDCPVKIEEGIANEIIISLENCEFNKVIEKYNAEVQEVLDKTQGIETQYSTLSSKFIGESQSIITILYDFWQLRQEDSDLYEVRNVTDGILRASGLIRFYDKMISEVEINGTKIANAIACKFLSSFLFLDDIQEYSTRMKMSLQEFKEGLEKLKKAGILKDGVGISV